MPVDSGALVLVDSAAFLFRNVGTLLPVLGAALLFIDSRALLFSHSVTALLQNSVALLLLHSGALLLLHSRAFLFVDRVANIVTFRLVETLAKVGRGPDQLAVFLRLGKRMRNSKGISHSQ